MSFELQRSPLLHLLHNGLFLLAFVLFGENPLGRHADGEALVEATSLTRLTRLFGHGTRAERFARVVLVLLLIHGPSEEGSTAVTRDGAVVQVVVGHVVAD